MSKLNYSPIVWAAKCGGITNHLALFEVRHGLVESYAIRDTLAPGFPKFIPHSIHFTAQKPTDLVKWVLGPDYENTILNLHNGRCHVHSVGWSKALDEVGFRTRLLDESMSKYQMGYTTVIAILNPRGIIAITNKGRQPESEYTEDIEAIKQACDENNLTLEIVDIDTSDKDTIAKSADRLRYALLAELLDEVRA